MAKTVSIKTVDGNRNNFTVDDDFDLESMMGKINAHDVMFRFHITNGTKYFNVRNIVSVTIKDEDE